MNQIVSFNDSVRLLLERVECRRVVEPNDREAVFRLRYASYLREGAVAAKPEASLSDPFDDAPNTGIFGVYIDGELASTIRIGVATADRRNIPAMKTFADCLDPILDAGQSMIDPTRFVLDERQAREHPKLPYVTLRIAWVISDYLGVDHTLATVRTEHQAFYRRFFGHRLLCPARPYPTLVKPLSLMILDCRDVREDGLRRYPFLASTPEECQALIGNSISA